MHILHFCAFLGREVKDWFTEIYTGQLAQHGGRRGYRGQCFDERCGGSGYYTLAMSVPMAVNTLYSGFFNWHIALGKQAPVHFEMLWKTNLNYKRYIKELTFSPNIYANGPIKLNRNNKTILTIYIRMSSLSWFCSCCLSEQITCSCGRWYVVESELCNQDVLSWGTPPFTYLLRGYWTNFLLDRKLRMPRWVQLPS